MSIRNLPTPYRTTHPAAVSLLATMSTRSWVISQVVNSSCFADLISRPCHPSLGGPLPHQTSESPTSTRPFVSLVNEASVSGAVSPRCLIGPWGVGKTTICSHLCGKVGFLEWEAL